MSELTDALHSIANTVSGFVEKLPPEDQAVAGAAANALHGFADNEITALVTKAAGVTVAPYLLPFILPGIDKLIGDLTTLKAQAVAPGPQA